MRVNTDLVSTVSACGDRLLLSIGMLVYIFDLKRGESREMETQITKHKWVLLPEPVEVRLSDGVENFWLNDSAYQALRRILNADGH